MGAESNRIRLSGGRRRLSLTGIEFNGGLIKQGLSCKRIDLNGVEFSDFCFQSGLSLKRVELKGGFVESVRVAWGLISMGLKSSRYYIQVLIVRGSVKRWFS